MRGKRAQLPGKDLLFGPAPAAHGQLEVTEGHQTHTTTEEEAVEPDTPAIEPPEPVTLARPRRVSAAKEARGKPVASSRQRAPAPVSERSRPGAGREGDQSPPHIQLCVWIDPSLNDQLDRLRARFLIDYGAKVTKSQIVEAVLAEALADERYVEGLVL